MPINTENINNIIIDTMEKPVDFEQFSAFIQKSPFIRRIAFVGHRIFDMPRFCDMVKLCAQNNISLIFMEMGAASDDKLRALVEYKNVVFINTYKKDKYVKTIEKFKQEFNSSQPDIHVIKKENILPQNYLSETSYSFYNMADTIEQIPCKNFILEPMIDSDGNLIGCCQNPDKKTPLNIFDLGIEKTFRHKYCTNIIKMLKTGKINTKCPCTRCPVFASLIWTNQTTDITKTNK